MNTFINDNPALAFFLAAGAGVLALLFCAYLIYGMSRLRRDQKIVLGDGENRDVIGHARDTDQRVDGLSQEIRGLAKHLEREGRRLDSCLTFRSVVRYDAYHDLSGMQSTTMCLLDNRSSGIIVSSIQSRDHARIYVREIRNGESQEKLSPEEVQVLKEAMSSKTPRPAPVLEDQATV